MVRFQLHQQPNALGKLLADQFMSSQHVVRQRGQEKFDWLMVDLEQDEQRVDVISNRVDVYAVSNQMGLLFADVLIDYCEYVVKQRIFHRPALSSQQTLLKTETIWEHFINRIFQLWRTESRRLPVEAATQPELFFRECLREAVGVAACEIVRRIKWEDEGSIYSRATEAFSLDMARTLILSIFNIRSIRDVTLLVVSKTDEYFGKAHSVSDGSSGHYF